MLSRLLVGALVIAAGCSFQDSLVGPDPVDSDADAGILFVQSGDFDAFVGDSIGFVISGDSAQVSGEALLLDAAASVVWRSPKWSASSGDTVYVALGNEAHAAAVGDSVWVTASVQDSFGRRSYAAGGAREGPRQFEDAERRLVRFFPGRHVPLRVKIDAVETAVDLGTVFVADQAGGRVGSVRIHDHAVSWFVADRGLRPASLSYRAGHLAVGTLSGAEVALLDVRSGLSSVIERRRSLLPPIFLRFQSQVPDALPEDHSVQPYVAEVSLGCRAVRGPDCDEFVAFGPSRSIQSQGGALRVLPVGSEDPVSPVVLPLYFEAPFSSAAREKAPTRVSVISGESSGGAEVTLAVQESGLECLTEVLGSGPVVVSPAPSAAVFVATRQEQSLCGPGSRIIRVDKAWSAAPTISVSAMRNLLGEDRIGAVRGMEVNSDGSHLALLGDDLVYLLDEYLRVRAVLPVSGANGIAWLGSDPNVFGVQVDGEANLYRIGEFGVANLATLTIGPSKEGSLKLMGTVGQLTAVAIDAAGTGLIFVNGTVE